MNKNKNIANYIYIGIIAVSMILAIVLFARFEKERAAEPVADTATTLATLEKKENVKITVNVETIQDGLQDMGTLITQEYFFTQVEHYTKDKKVLSVFNSSSELMYSYDGKVTAGIEFGDINVSKDEDAKMIIVELPHSTIQDVVIDPSSFKKYSEKESLWNQLKIEDYNLSLIEFEEEAKDRAIKNGILDKSDDQAKTLIANFIKNFPNVSDYGIEITFKEDKS